MLTLNEMPTLIEIVLSPPILGSSAECGRDVDEMNGIMMTEE